MIDRAEADGSLTHDKTILEPTSGNTGIALAFIARRKGYRIKVVMPENVSGERAQLLQAYGAEIVFSDGAKGTNGAIVVAEQMAAEDSTYFMPYQYGNEANPRAHYETTGREIIEGHAGHRRVRGRSRHGRHAHGRRPAPQGVQPVD